MWHLSNGHLADDETDAEVLFLADWLQSEAQRLGWDGVRQAYPAQWETLLAWLRRLHRAMMARSTADPR